jgi:Ca2+-binding RTX toxin-like protein
MAVKIGDADNQAIGGGDDRDYISGLEGNDSLYGYDGADALYGGDGDDFLFPNGYDPNMPIPDFVPLNDGADRLDGGDGFDFVSYNNVPVIDGVVTRIDLQEGGISGAAIGDTYFSIEGVIGTGGVDYVLGDGARNIFQATEGGDRYNGRSGLDAYVGRSNVASGEAITMELAYGARAVTLARGISLTAGEGVAAYITFNDTNKNGRVDNGETIVRKTLDRLAFIEEVSGSTGRDTLGGSDGDDILGGSGGADVMTGNKGFDFVSYANYSLGGGRGVTVDLGSGEAVKYAPVGNAPAKVTDRLKTIEGAIGTDQSDELVGSTSNNILFGRGGNDALDGGSGKDVIVGGSGNDILLGGDGNDTLSGGIGVDVMDGGAGRDLASYANAETSIAVNLLKSAGWMPIIDGVDITDAESIRDRLVSIEDIDGSAFADVIKGGTDANVLQGLGGGDKIIGCDGNDTIWGEQNGATTLPDLTVPGDLHGDGACDCCDDEGTGDGSAAVNDDALYGSDGADVIYGGLGMDLLDGGHDSDSLDGGVGIDILHGGSGNDTISGGAGFDFIFGDAGTDTVSYQASGAAVMVNLQDFTGNAGGDASSDLIAEILDSLVGGDDPAALIGSSLFLALATSLGSDDDNGAFSLSIPDVTLSMENASGSAFDDTLFGNNDSNVLDGKAGGDGISAGLGRDTLVGGAGLDTLRGGEGADRFVFNSGDFGGKTAQTADRIRDFSHAEGDRINLSSIDTVAGGKDQAFSFLGTGAFSGKAGQIRYAFVGDETQIMGDLNGDKKIDFMIVLEDRHALTAADFLL